MPCKTKETQNQSQVDDYRENGPVQLGPWTSHIWRSDPKHLSFLLARYKFCAKMLSGKSSVLEVGCGDAFGTPLVLQEVDTVHGIDFEPIVIEDIQRRMELEGNPALSAEVWDITAKPLESTFDAAFSMDVIEHIPPELEGQFFRNICGSLRSDGLLIVGTPNVTSQSHASAASEEGHINLKSGSELKGLLLEYFDNAFLFSMNDEVVHTGFSPMAHYLIAVGVGCRSVTTKC